MALSPAVHLRDRLLDVKYNRIPQGMTLGVDEIDEYLRFKRGAFNICVGHANTGKTTVILYLMTTYAMKHGLKWLVFSSENTDYSIARKVIEFRTNTTIQQLSDDQINENLKWVNDHFKIISVDKIYTARTLMAEAKEIHEQWKYDGLLIDPYNSLAKDPTVLRSVGGHEYDYQIASEMRLFSKENDVSIWLNAHAVTEALRRVYEKDHEFAGLPKPPSMADVEGGGKWGNRADDVITIHRMTQHSTKWNVSEIHVRKVKETESGGKPTPIDAPIALKMEIGNTAFTCAGQDPVEIIKRAKGQIKPPTKLEF